MTTIALSSNTSWYIYNFRRNTINRLLEDGFDVVVIAPKDDYSMRLVVMGVQYIDIDIDQGGTNPFKDLKTFLMFYRIYSNVDVDVVLNFTPKNNIYSTLAASFRGVKSINNISGLGYLFVQRSIASWVARILYRITQNNASKIFFQNTEDASMFMESGWLPNDKISIIPGSGVDLDRFTVTRSPDDGVVRFTMISRMLFDKGVLQFIEAARYLKSVYAGQVEFRLLGFLSVNNPSSVSQDQMNEWVDEGVVVYLGVTDCVEKEIGFTDCIVFPSFYREGVPKSLLEAGAMGKPIVTTDNVGCKEVVDHCVNGYLCEKRNTQSLIEMLQKVIKMSYSERVYMGLKSRMKIERQFDEKIVIEKYMKAIRKVLL